MTRFLDQIGIRLPIIQAPMAGVATPQMAAAVTEAGGLGSIGVGATNADGARTMIEGIRALTQGPFNVNVFVHDRPKADAEREAAWLAGLVPVFARFGATPPTALREIYMSFLADEAMLQLLIATRPTVVSFHFGLPPAASIAALKASGIILFASVTSLDEADKAIGAGVDALVAQGIEAGGHRGVFDPAAPDDQLSAAALTQLLVRHTALPVIAAGGIMDGAGIAAMLDLGAAAAQLGTAFVPCPESSADEAYRAALTGPGAAHTQLTRLVSGRPARILANDFAGLKDQLAGLTPPDFPIAYDAGKALNAAAKAAGDTGYGAQWAGQGAPLTRSMPAGDLVRVLAEELAAVRKA
jgi:nitronate monooxygenase